MGVMNEGLLRLWEALQNSHISFLMKVKSLISIATVYCLFISAQNNIWYQSPNDLSSEKQFVISIINLILLCCVKQI